MSNAAENVLQFPDASDVQVRRYPLRDGDPGIAHTIRIMRGFVQGREGAPCPSIRQLALQLTRGIEASDKAAQLQAVLDWVKKHIDFRGEYKETLQTPLVTLQMGAGDCDDHSMLICALMKSLGFRTRFNTVAADSDDPQQFTHVFAEVMDPQSGEWRAMDSTVPSSYPGWRPANVYRQKAWQPMGDLLSSDTLFGDPTTSGADIPITQLITTLALPIDQAVANKITYGDRTGLATLGVGNFSPVGAGSQGSTWLWLLVGLGVLFVVTRR